MATLRQVTCLLLAGVAAIPDHAAAGRDDAALAATTSGEVAPVLFSDTRGTAIPLVVPQGADGLSLVIGAPWTDAGSGLAFPRDPGQPTFAPLGPMPRPPSGLLVPALEVLAIEGLVLGAAKAMNEPYANVSVDSVAHNLRHGFTYDDDDFHTNMFLHPYLGGMYFSTARSSGFSYWASIPFAFFGSLLWEYAGETQLPATNDQIMTSAGGIVVGEALFRLSRMVLASPGRPGLGRRLLAAVINPVNGFNDLVLGDRLHDPEDDVVGPFTGRVTLGASVSAFGARPLAAGATSARVAFQITDGPPAEVVFKRPFDHFDLYVSFASDRDGPGVATAARGATWELLVRGLMAGGTLDLAGGRSLAGVYGLLDYTGPGWTRVAATGFGPGATTAWQLGNAVALEATALVAGAFGSVGGATPLVDLRDYHYGFTVVGVLDLRLRADRFELRADAHEYLAPSTVGGGSEDLTLAHASLVLRVAGPHGVGLEGEWTNRHASLPGADLHQRWVSTSISYVLMLGR